MSLSARAAKRLAAFFEQGQPATPDIMIVVPSAVQAPLLRWVVSQGLDVYPVIAEDDTLQVFRGGGE